MLFSRFSPQMYDYSHGQGQGHGQGHGQGQGQGQGHGIGSEFASCTCHYKMALASNGTGNHLIKSTLLNKTQSPVSCFSYSRSRICD